MTKQFNIKVGDEVAVFTFWAKLPKKHKVALVTPTGKIRVEGYEEYLLTPKECYQTGTPWSAQTNREMRSVHFYPWTESHDRRIQAAQQQTTYDAKVRALRDAVQKLHHSEVEKIDALYDILFAPENK